MSEPKFTKGPWRVGPYGGVYPLGNGSMIASADTKSGYLPNHENNEILIAMSPRMFHALYDIRMNNAGTVERKRGWDEAYAILEELGVTE